MTTATVTSEQRLLDRASDYVQRRSSFADLYYLAGELIIEFIHEDDAVRTKAFIGAVFQAEVEHADDDSRRLAIVAAIAAMRGIDVRRSARALTASDSQTVIDTVAV